MNYGTIDSPRSVSAFRAPHVRVAAEHLLHDADAEQSPGRPSSPNSDLSTDAARGGAPPFAADRTTNGSQAGMEMQPLLMPRMPVDSREGQPPRSQESFIESSLYPEPDSAVYEAAQSAKSTATFRRRTFSRWVFNFLIALFVALVAVLITFVTRHLTEWRFEVLNLLIQLERDGVSGFGTALSGYLAVSLSYALAAAVATAYIAPAAAGSGISEIKCILNGVVLPNVLNVKTLIVKVFGLMFSVSSGLPVGREGPMIHTGAIAASGLTQGKSSTMGFDTRWSVYTEFRNDKEKRDFVACGAAAGVAAAFGAPIGGVLFAIEEGATHWRRALVWRTFFCAIVTAWINQVLGSGLDGNWGQMTSTGMFNFGTFSSDSNLTWQAWELPFFIALGAVGGFVGVAFSALQVVITKFRMKYVPVSKPFRRVLEVFFVISLKMTVEFLLGVLFSSCQERPVPAQSSDESYANDLQSFYCDASSYNEMASLWMVPAEDAIKQLFHFSNPFSLAGLAVFFAVYLGLMCLTYGISVPAGVFIPALLSGSALGRLLGEFLRSQLPTSSVNAGVYSLVGAAAILGGVTRMTISLAVILLETTGNYEFALPITSALLAARFVGNWFNSGIYDVHIELRKWPLLSDTIPTALSKQLRVTDIMAKPPIVLREIAEVGNVWDILNNTTHNGFPVVYSEQVMKSHPRIGSLAGMIGRNELAVLLKHRAFHPTLPSMPLSSLPISGTPSAVAAYTATTNDVFPNASRVHREHLAPSPLGADGSVAGQSALPAEMPLVPASRRPSFRRARQVHTPAAKPRSLLSHLFPAPRPRPEVKIRLPSVVGSGQEGFWAVANAAVDSSATEADDVAAEYNNSYKITMADPGSKNDTLQFVAESDILQMVYTDEPLLKYEEFQAYYPENPDITGMRFSEKTRRLYVDLRPYLNPTPHTIHMHAPITRAFELFQMLGLRHLVVVNDSHDVVGVLTRHDFRLEHLRACAKHRRLKNENRKTVAFDSVEEDDDIDSSYNFHDE